MTLSLWIGIIPCLSQSAMLSGLNLAFFTISKLELQMEVAKGNHHARRVLTLRNDANFLLVTILWANVAVNVLLAMLSGWVLAGIAAFVFSTVIITIFGEILPQLKGKITGMAMRVPVPNGSITDMTVSLGKDVTAEEVNEALRKASVKSPLRAILRVTNEALVSQDVIGDSHSSIVDALSTMVLNDRIVKIPAWYDNEWGYSARLVDFAEFMAGKGLYKEKA
jgi:hypothetical protein